MKIKLLSDLHFEFGLPLHEVLPDCADADVCILAGDIHVGATKTANILNKFAEVYTHVIYLPGNHEYYGHSMEDVDTALPTLTAPNVHILNREYVKIDDVTFIGATLWTNFDDNELKATICKRSIADFKYIKGFSTKIAADLYLLDSEYIKARYAVTEGKKVIITHFLPAKECIAPQFKDEKILNAYFANDLGPWINTLRDTTWCFGHTHTAMDFTLGETRMICNPHGYYMHENNDGFSAHKVFEL